MKHYRNLILCAYFFQYLTSYKSISIEIGIDTYHSITFFRIPHFRFYYFVSFISKSNVLIYIVAVHDGWTDGRTDGGCLHWIYSIPTYCQRSSSRYGRGIVDFSPFLVVFFHNRNESLHTKKEEKQQKRQSRTLLFISCCFFFTLSFH